MERCLPPINQHAVIVARQSNVMGAIMKSQILDHLKEVIGRDKKRFGKLVTYDGHDGFSEDALKGLEDLEARTPPPEAIIEPAYSPSYVYRDRLSPQNAAGGGLVKGDDGAKRPHYWGHRERLRQTVPEGRPRAYAGI